ncbi:MAG: hypothetical protein LBQ66_11105 [Planctomycetaceae bacterium]|nr:hypothetical protein [Planctomycetaceae bacterium]
MIIDHRSMIIDHCALQQAVGLHRSVENDVPTQTAFRRNATIGRVTGLHSYGMRRLGGGSFSTERYIPNGM